ncbi:Multidrug resistance protein MdtC [Posidoniimonas polymericola]|uniref:Multidrug resistance protein MdtC n=1 Tax=Posidoniimonas polymericola TaxID=2528002 RepID=A0A5C5XYH4_9BACT|nr:efflux RND transporter permease subunit [Posidoniimonas polymericola]TWT67591.1 Multidrug resistance protein MdtC [Posidoniimonas polymericola]
MNVTDLAIERPRTVSVLTLLVILLAFYAAFFSPVQRSPAITKAVVIVAIPYPDSDPSKAENNIARKVEDELKELQSVDFIASTSMRGSAVTQVIFLDGVDPDEARAEVQDLVNRITNELPTGREVQPIVTDIDFENMPLMLLNITAPPGLDDRTLKTIAEDVQDELEAVDGVANTQLFGGKEREIHVNVNPDLMSQYGITLAQVRQALANFHAEVPAGEFTTGEFDRGLRNETELRGVSDIRDAVVSSQGGRVIRVSDIAEVLDAHRKVMNLAEFDNRAGALIMVNKEADINTLGAARGVREVVAGLRDEYPDFEFSITRDASSEIWVMFRVLGSSAVFGAMLVLVILAWTMGLRISLLVLIAIPFSMAVALQFLFFSGIPVSNMVVFSFILVLGMVVDGAIIVAENIYRHIERGEEPLDAAKNGIHEVGVPVIAADLTTIAAFLPMLLVPGIMGDFMSVMPKVVSVALLGSVLVDHFVIPTVAARWYKKRVPVNDESQSFHTLTAAGGDGPQHGVPQHRARIRPDIGFFTRLYARVLRFSLAHRGFVMIWCLMAMWGAKILIGQLGFNFFPTSDRGQFIVKYELPLGYSIDETLDASRVITEPLQRWDKSGILSHYVTSAGSSGGLAVRVDDDPATGPEFGQVQVELVPPMDRDIHEQEVIRYLRDNIRPIPGMTFSVEEIQDGPPGGADVSVRLTGDDLTQLGKIANEIADRMGQVRGAVDVKTDFRDESPELIIEPMPNMVGLFDLDEARIAQAVQTAIAGDNRIQITLDDEDVDIRIQLAPEYRRRPEELERLTLTGAGGERATIGQLADLRRDSGLYSINRYERERAVVAKCNVVAPTTAADVFRRINNEILPELGFRPVQDSERSLEGFAKNHIGRPTTPAEGVHAEFTGENDERDENFGYLLWSMVIGVVLIAAILAMQFNSFRQSAIVMITVPLSFIGVVIGMWASGFPFSLASFIGLVSLTGIVVNDAIVLVDFANQARKRGLPVREALIEAGVNRLRPVLLTTVTTIGGLLPLLLNISGGAEFWQPLTGAVVFGLSFATVLTLVVIPCCYLIAYNIPLWIWRALAALFIALIALAATSSISPAVGITAAACVLLPGAAFAGIEFMRARNEGEALLWDRNPA